MFSLSALAVLAAGVAYLCTRSALRGRARRGRHPLVSALLVMLWVLLFAGGGYAVLVFAFHGMYLAALPVLAALLLGLGYVAYVLQGKKGPV